MKMKMGDVLIHKDSAINTRYGTGVVTSITNEEYTILWSGHGVARYRRSIVDEKMDDIFQRVEREVLPKERHIRLGASKIGVPFNENYDREKIASLCEELKMSGIREATDVAEIGRAHV